MAVRQFQRVNMAIKICAGSGSSGSPRHGAWRRMRDQYALSADSGDGRVLYWTCRAAWVWSPAGRDERNAHSRERAFGRGRKPGFISRAEAHFETIAMAKVSTSGEEARSLGFLRPSDLISMNRDRQVADAKRTALAMVRAGYHPPAPAEIRVLGDEFLAAAKLAIHMLVRGEFATEYDGVVGRNLANILAGGALARPKCFRTIHSRSRARSFRQPVRRAQDPGARGAHAENWQTLAELSSQKKSNRLTRIARLPSWSEFAATPGNPCVMD